MQTKDEKMFADRGLRRTLKTISVLHQTDYNLRNVETKLTQIVRTLLSEFTLKSLFRPDKTISFRWWKDERSAYNPSLD